MPSLKCFGRCWEPHRGHTFEAAKNRDTSEFDPEVAMYYMKEYVHIVAINAIRPACGIGRARVSRRQAFLVATARSTLDSLVRLACGPVHFFVRRSLTARMPHSQQTKAVTKICAVLCAITRPGAVLCTTRKPNWLLSFFRCSLLLRRA